MKNKLLPLLLAGTLLLSGCGTGNNQETNSEKDSENQVTTNNSESNKDSENNKNSESNKNSENSKDSEKNDSTTSSEPIDADFSQTQDDMFSDRDSKTEYNDSGSIKIQLNGSSATCSSNKVQIEGSKITIKDEGTYIISGTLDDGMILVNAEESDKPQLILNNANITSATSAPIYILEGDKVFITLADDSTNTLTNGGTFTAIDENNINAAVYSKQDLTFNGNGSLTVTSPAGHGISCKDDLVFTGGTYTVTSSSHALDANDSLRVDGGTFTLDAGKDGIHVENSDNAEKGFIYVSGGTFNIEAEGDGLDAGYYMQIENGSFDILCGGGYKNGSQSSSDNWGNMGGGTPGGNWGGGGMRPGRPGRTSDDTTGNISDATAGSATTTTDDSTSMKGLKADSSILINGGTFTIDSADDSVHSNLSVYINKGTFNIASGDDGVHAEEELTITGGTVTITQSYEGLEALNVKVTGGDINLKSTDDGINAAGGTDASGTGGRDQMFGGGMGGGFGGHGGNSNGSIVITGGSIFMYAAGDGIDANGYLEITGGKTIVTGPTQGDTAILDYDSSATITDGTFIGVGSTMMAQSFSKNEQGVLAVKGSGAGGTTIAITDKAGKTIVSFTPETNFACIIISTPDMVSGESYTISVGGQTATFEAQ